MKSVIVADDLTPGRRSPQGERGLKFDKGQAHVIDVRVAPRKGSAD